MVPSAGEVCFWRAVSLAAYLPGFWLTYMWATPRLLQTQCGTPAASHYLDTMLYAFAAGTVGIFCLLRRQWAAAERLFVSALVPLGFPFALILASRLSELLPAGG